MVVDDAVPDAAEMEAWGEALARLFTDTELIVVANGVTGEVALALEALACVTPDLTVHFLADRIELDTARLVGMDMAIGDWVLLAELGPHRLDALPELVAPVRKGYQAISLRNQNEPAPGSWAVRLARAARNRLYFALTKRKVLNPEPRMRLYSRAAALYIAGSPEGEMLLKTQTVAGGFPSIAGQVPGLSPDTERAVHWGIAGSKAVQDLLRASALPLRLASLVALTSGALSLVYSLYVVATYLLKSSVERGWTTLSLQISGMMFLFSLLFALLAEYVLAIYRGMPPKRRYIITRELRSPNRRSHPRLNVINEGGDYYLGMPLASPKSPLPDQQPSDT
jgi:hypothetical protein